MTISRNQIVNLEILTEKGLNLSMKREDEIHPFISGNKYRKLKYNLINAKAKGFTKLLSYGGAFSNHISALSYAGKVHGFKTIGVIRGDELGVDIDQTLETNPTLKFAHDNGMKLEFISRDAYKRKNDPDQLVKLESRHSEFYEIPEGGTNMLAIKGCEEILTDADLEFDYICVAVGTGGTISGLINASSETQSIIGFPSLKGQFLDGLISEKVGNKMNWKLMHEYHFGGYAKINEFLIRFINDFNQQTTIPLDPIYTGKMMFGIMDLVKNDFFKKNSSILVVHTGGLQGIEGMNKRLIKKDLPLINV